MKQVQMYIDFSCPYCLKGYDIVKKVQSDYKDIEFQCVPCEAHPRPEEWHHHSDLLARGYYIALDLGMSASLYQDVMYKAAVTDKIDIDDLQAVKKVLADYIDVDQFEKAMNDGAYLDELNTNNQACWGTYNFFAVPSFVYQDKTLGAIPMEGVYEEGLREFLDKL